MLCGDNVITRTYEQSRIMGCRVQFWVLYKKGWVGRLWFAGKNWFWKVVASVKKIHRCRKLRETSKRESGIGSFIWFSTKRELLLSNLQWGFSESFAKFIPTGGARLRSAGLRGTKTGGLSCSLFDWLMVWMLDHWDRAIKCGCEECSHDSAWTLKVVVSQFLN